MIIRDGKIVVLISEHQVYRSKQAFKQFIDRNYGKQAYIAYREYFRFVIVTRTQAKAIQPCADIIQKKLFNEKEKGWKMQWQKPDRTVMDNYISLYIPEMNVQNYIRSFDRMCQKYLVENVFRTQRDLFLVQQVIESQARSDPEYEDCILRKEICRKIYKGWQIIVSNQQ